MKKRANQRRAPKGFPAVHDQAVKRLAAGLKPVRPAWPVLAQLAVWGGGMVAFGFLLFQWMPLRNDLSFCISFLPYDLMLILCFWGAALAAWAALEWSFPGQELEGKWKLWAAGLSWLGTALLFLFFTPWTGGGYSPQFSPFSCFAVVFLVGLASWVFLGLLIRRNAPLDSRWVGTWAGAAAFLLGLGVITLHCGSHNLRHVCLEHFLPVLAYSWLTGWLGSKWLCAWKQKPLSK